MKISGFVVEDKFEQFLNEAEENKTGATFAVYGLEKPRNTWQILLDDLGHFSEYAKFVHMWELLERQPDGPNGKKDILAVDGNANVFFIKQNPSCFWAVFCGWKDDGWVIGAVHHTGQWVWQPGTRIFASAALTPHTPTASRELTI